MAEKKSSLGKTITSFIVAGILIVYILKFAFITPVKWDEILAGGGVVASVLRGLVNFFRPAGDKIKALPIKKA